MTAETALEALLERVDAAQDRLDQARAVETAFKLEAVKAQRAYIQANREAPHTAATLALDKAHRQAVRQWAAAQADANAAYRSLASYTSRTRREGAERARTARQGRNGSQVHPGPDRAGDSHQGRAS